MNLNNTAIKARTSTPSRAALCWDMGIPAISSNGSFALRNECKLHWKYIFPQNNTTCFLDCQAISKIKAACSANEYGGHARASNMLV
jgi:hypothetical protein